MKRDDLYRILALHQEWLAGLIGARANLSGADLSGTILDQAAPLPEISDSDLGELTHDGEWVYGVRTAKSQICGATEYLPGSAHAAPWFSVDGATDCHPGLYLSGPKWLFNHYPSAERVEVRCLRSELLRAGDKWRAKRLWVRCADGTWPEVQR